MRTALCLAALVAPLAALEPSPVYAEEAPAALAFTMETLSGDEVDLAEKYRGKVVLFVNVASKCGYTRQYKPLEELYEKYADQGLVVVGVPCNQFGGQEPGTSAEIAAFCERTYDVKFDLLRKVEVNGPGQCPLYAYLTKESPFPGPIAWNFEKFLVGRDGAVVGRFKSAVEPTDAAFVAAIEKELAK